MIQDGKEPRRLLAQRNCGARYVGGTTAEYLAWGFTGCVIQQFWPDDCASTSGGG